MAKDNFCNLTMVGTSDDLVKVITKVLRKTIKGNPEGKKYSLLSQLGKELHNCVADYQAIIGGTKLVDFLKSQEKFIVFQNEQGAPCIGFKPYKADSIAKTGTSETICHEKNKVAKGKSMVSKAISLINFAFFIGGINEMLKRCFDLIRAEYTMGIGRSGWDFKNMLPYQPKYPILFLYLNYTFLRIQKEGKLYYSINNDMCAFNTGLVDEHYQPVIMLFKKNKEGLKSQWKFFDFVIEGQSKTNGKIISKFFKESIVAANYKEHPEDLIYNEGFGSPVIDYDHILIERADRLPYEFIKANAPSWFVVKEISSLSKEERNEYIDGLKDAIESDSSWFRKMKTAFEDAVAQTMRRIQWDFHTAVPIYYPKENKVCLALPICLVDENKEDIVLIVKRTPANKYEGATILSLDLAYADARVISCPESAWLDASKISGTTESLI